MDDFDKMIFDIKKKRLEMSRKRNVDWISKTMEDIFADEISKEIDRKIIQKILDDYLKIK